ncbi:Alpha/Beta hydrolase protein [Calycina marina]|uniref:Alpha/Beta hydrolase protein n=1 Tax=Calycina marina TaxID=1763456 RepID=A0A9P7Z1R4_9HELO|nr:Alpha/Beta hydrolase protein [Calycina marina]
MGWRMNAMKRGGFSSKTATEIPVEVVSISALRRISDSSVVLLGATPIALQALYQLDLFTATALPQRTLKALCFSRKTCISQLIISKPKLLSLPRTRGTLKGFAHAIDNAPHNIHFSAPTSTLPPLTLYIHGGLVANRTIGLVLETQFWTSCRYEYCKVTYAGLIGHGRAYRELLNANWGIVDVDDAIFCEDYLVKEGLVDGTRIRITGGSAGGVHGSCSTCIISFRLPRGFFIFGVANLKTFAEVRHKHEMRFPNSLFWPPSATEEQ